MKKLSLLFSILCLSIFLFGCQRSNPLSIVFFDKSLKGSDKNVITLSVGNDKLYKEKVFDLMIKSDKDITISIAEELNNYTTYEFSKDEWYYMTDILSIKPYEYKKVSSKTYLIKPSVQSKLYFVAVVGNEKIENEKGLTNEIVCSKVFELETVKPK